MQSCNGKRRFFVTPPTAQDMVAWNRKNCPIKRTTREFHPGGPEAGTLTGARRAPGLFDDGWGTEFPLTRREQKKLQEGIPVPNPFFAPPTYAYEGNWIKDKLENLRRKMAGTSYTTALNINPLCGPRGSMTTCSTAHGTYQWISETTVLTQADNERFVAAYCKPNCAAPGSAAPPAGFTQRNIVATSRNPDVRRAFSCPSNEPQLPIITPLLPIIPDVVRAAAAAPPPVTLGCLHSGACNAESYCINFHPSHEWLMAWTVEHCGPFYKYLGI